MQVIPPQRPQVGNSEPVYQMLWDCRFCGTQKLLGVDQRFCPNCGGQQDPKWRYFPSEEDKKLVTDPNYKYAGADKICPFCQTPNSAAANYCKQCGGDLSDAKEAELQGIVQTGSAEHTGKARDLVKEQFMAQQALTVKPPKLSKSAIIGIAAVAVLVIAAIVGFLALSRSTYAASLEVRDATWERIIHVERLTAVPGSDWRDAIPFGARVGNCYTADRPYTRSETYQCGTDKVDRGDGSFIERPRMCTRQITEYRPDTKCDYVVDRWIRADDLRTSGGPSVALSWANFTPTGVGGLGSTREAGREEILKVLFTGLDGKAGQNYDYRAKSEAEWRTFQVGQRYEVLFNRLEQIQWDTLKAAEPR